ncbi:hypothetical protein FH972_009382 [Carpinus fangiana]|uniref:SBP-type domain-containing protein n=1 Tax=Carpinus fangiana TaxID=176857 RepID=A0A5N6R1Q7_9ROSI|nr:hypothetical protein FH972_009382 [Carpinus fangiana]KAE8023713.1 hypothetical protein FH972_009382 [Carpinus fangiana]
MMESSSSSGSTKRARAASSGALAPSCLVDGCTSDLSKCRDYHRRHKVCENHSKTPRVTIRGLEQRFCQQCSRFHSLGEFDEGKRSCRKRLDGHNRRRRKPQPESRPLNSGRFLSGYQGTTILTFSNPQILPQAAVVSSAWLGPVKAETGAAVICNSYSQMNFCDRKNSINPGSLSHNYKGGKQFQFSQASSSSLPGASVSCHPLPDANFAYSNASSSQKVFPIHRGIDDSDCALSLLSSTPAEARQVGLGHMVQYFNPITPAQSVSSALVTDSSSNANLHCQDMFSIWPDGSSAGGPHHHTHSFLWE